MFVSCKEGAKAHVTFEDGLRLKTLARRSDLVDRSEEEVSILATGRRCLRKPRCLDGEVGLLTYRRSFTD